MLLDARPQGAQLARQQRLGPCLGLGAGLARATGAGDAGNGQGRRGARRSRSHRHGDETGGDGVHDRDIQKEKVAVTVSGVKYQVSRKVLIT